MSYYILLGSANHLKYFRSAESYPHREWFWTAPKTAKVGETAFVYLAAPVSRIVGSFEFVKEPFYNIDRFDGDWKNCWWAQVGNVKYFEPRPELTMKGLRSLFPDWPWLRYPRGKVRIPDDIITPFLELIGKSKSEDKAPYRFGEILSLLNGYRFNFQSEKELQDGIELLLMQSEVSFEREYHLSDRDIIDFQIEGVGVEVKTKGSLATVTRQLHRYAQFDEIESLILVTSKSAHTRLGTDVLNGKPVAVLSLVMGGAF